MIVKILSVIVAIFIGFRVLSFIVGRLHYLNRIRHRINLVLPIIELLVWIGTIMWIVKLIYETHNYELLISLGVIFLLFIVPAFSLLRDFISGISLKAQSTIFLGAFLEVNQIQGEVVKVGHFVVELKDSHGDIRTYPYSQIRSKVILRTSDNVHLVKLKLEFQIPDNNHINDTLKTIIHVIINTPWCAPSKMPVVDQVVSNNGVSNVIVGVYSLNKSYGEKIKGVVDLYLQQNS
ncbi:MAG: mechanosensitive ion channel [Salinivirgaceae bacterium]|nr:mechanosensitive ion channel [Salinivirgaceae bacterium]MDD4746223.1 mechanosensitive ion channel [Salinivirgaceae bacterium]